MSMPDAEVIIEGTGTSLVQVKTSASSPFPAIRRAASVCCIGTGFSLPAITSGGTRRLRELASPQAVGVECRAALHRSIEQLTKYSFDWVLAGHGGRVQLPRPDMQAALHALIEGRRQGRA
jgi:hypothetical protein